MISRVILVCLGLLVLCTSPSHALMRHSGHHACDGTVFIVMEGGRLHNTPSIFSARSEKSAGLWVCAHDTWERWFHVWHQVVMEDGSQGWMREAHLALAPDALSDAPASAQSQNNPAHTPRPTDTPRAANPALPTATFTRRPPTSTPMPVAVQCRDAWGTNATGYQIRSGPGTQHASTGHLVVQGEKVCALDSAGDWVQLRKSNGVAGYVHGDGLSFSAPSAVAALPTATFTRRPPTATPAPVAVRCRDAWGTSSTGYQIRSGPGTQHAPTGHLVVQGEKVCALDSAGDWVQLRKSNGVAGYVHVSGLSYTVPSAAPVQPTATFTRQPPTPTPIVRAASSGGGDAYASRLSALRVSPHTQVNSYDRDDWGSGWSDSDRDCQNTRHEVLITESQSAVTFTNSRGCSVATGLWIGPWSGERFTNSRDLDIDHHVPLKNAHISGGAAWSSAQKRAYYNDQVLPAALQAMKNSLNRTKGAQGPESWRPPLSVTWCRYARDWIDVKSKYNLSVTQAEQTALAQMLGTCTNSSNAGSPVAAPLPAAQPTPTPVPPAAPADDETGLPLTNGYRCSANPFQHLETDLPYRTCSSFQSRAEFNEYYQGAFHPGHDRDKDCLPCEALQ